MTEPKSDSEKDERPRWVFGNVGRGLKNMEGMEEFLFRVLRIGDASISKRIPTQQIGEFVMDAWLWNAKKIEVHEQAYDNYDINPKVAACIPISMIS